MAYVRFCLRRAGKIRAGNVNGFYTLHLIFIYRNLCYKMFTSRKRGVRINNFLKSLANQYNHVGMMDCSRHQTSFNHITKMVAYNTPFKVDLDFLAVYFFGGYVICREMPIECILSTIADRGRNKQNGQFLHNIFGELLN